MATKNISITEEAYNRLANLRKGNESFSEIIIEITRKKKLGDFFGVLSKKAGDELESNIKLIREMRKKASQERIGRLKRVFE